MLSQLYIENLAVIEKASIDLTPYLNVFTGETGAGKSILINGINAILGQRTSKDIVRTGANKAVITAVFEKIPDACSHLLSNSGISCDDGQLFLEREIKTDGGSVARINNRPVSVSLLKQVGDLLVNIHGQHDNQILLSPDRHIEILDSYSDAQSLLDDYQSSFHKLQSIAKEISHIKADSNQRQFRISQLYDMINEIECLKITPDEDKKISRELNVSKNAVALSEAFYAVNTILSGSDNTTGVVESLMNADSYIKNYPDVIPKLGELSERLNNARIEIKDISDEIESLNSKLNVDPKRFDWLNQRSEDLRKICKKYGPELDDVLKALNNAQIELEKLQGSEQSLDKLEEEKNALLTEVSKKAMKLSRHRSKAGERFVQQVTAELEFLNMPNVKIVVKQEKGKLTLKGMDNIEFLISANLGEEPRPMAKIASGGELSRIMLALKNVIARKDSIDTLIFDEIDTGVSGIAAQKIGMKLGEISRFRQVLCVTHLAQIAVVADNHLLIEKNVVGDRTVTSVRSLEKDERKNEIARIMGGNSITPLLLENAQQLLDEAAKMKNKPY
ncbi:DNA repair protein RecN [Ruminococcus sp. FC2018]|uniref:DNA repair protein RecN n=1 Tax=Ruminococcus sp. FC2018 TaxID=1410617 RepID=UPI00048DCAB5|nr:DNA repair protein RecN [Ruminococcus sp. FC2018]